MGDAVRAQYAEGGKVEGADNSPPSWDDLLMFARVDMGLTVAEFWDMTPVHFYGMAERWGQKQKREFEGRQWLAAMVCAAVYEQNRDRKKRSKPFTAADFMPAEKKKKQTPEEMLETVKQIHGRIGG